MNNDKSESANKLFSLAVSLSNIAQHYPLALSHSGSYRRKPFLFCV